MKSGVTELCQDQPHTLTDVNIGSFDIKNQKCRQAQMKWAGLRKRHNQILQVMWT